MEKSTNSYTQLKAGLNERAASLSRFNTWFERGVIIAFWVFIFIFSLLEEAFEHPQTEGVTFEEAIRSAGEGVCWILITFFIFWLTKQYTFERETWGRYVLVHVFIGGIIVLLVQAYSYHTARLLLPMAEWLPPTFWDSLTYILFEEELIIYILVLAAGFARSYSIRHMEEAVLLREQAVVMHSKLADARLHALRMQLNPHFLFNTLNSVSVLVEKDPKGVRKMIALLGELLRYVLEQTEEQEVTLRQEMKFLRSYFQIQLIRFQGKLEVKEDFSDAMLDALIPSLILQPLAENAIKHGVGSIVGQGVIELSGEIKDDMLYLSVRDNGPGLAGNGKSSTTNIQHVGLNNIRERLVELYGDRAGLVLEPAGSDGGLVATVSLPYKSSAISKSVVEP